MRLPRSRTARAAIAGGTVLLALTAGKCDTPPEPGPGQVAASAAPAQRIVPRSIVVVITVHWTAAGRRLHLPIDIHWDGAAHGTTSVSTRQDGDWHTDDILLAPTRSVTLDAHQAEAGWLACLVTVKDDGHGGTALGDSQSTRKADWISCTAVNHAPVD